MRAHVPVELLTTLPLHDSEFISLSVTPLTFGDVSEKIVDLVVELHADESLERFSGLAVRTRLVRFTCEKCWQICIDILGCGTAREFVSDWEIVKNSELIN